MAEENGNEQPQRVKGVSQLIITLEHESFTVTFGGSVQNYDAALCMLEIARRHFEGLLRASQVRQVLSAPAGAQIEFPPRRGH